MDVNLQRRQAVRRKGFVWNKVASLSRLEDQNVDRTKSRIGKLTRKRGSSLELAPSLLSIFDSIASSNRSTDQHDSGQPVQRSTKVDSSAQPTAQRAPTIKIDGENCDHSNTMDPCNVDANSNKKRPLSMSSVSSSSTSSLPRHTTKRPNLSEYDPRNSLRERMEHKLDNLLYIDDDVTNGAADDEMSVDTDGENNNKNELDNSSNKTQSTASLSSNDNRGEHHLSETNSNDHDRSNGCHGNLNTSDVCNDSASFSTPGSSILQSPDTSFTPTQSPLVTGQGQTPVQGHTPTSTSSTPVRNSSLRDSTSPQKYVSRVQRVVAEIVDTEKCYVGHLREIIEGYMKYLQSLDQQCIGKKEAVCLFGNIQDIYEFSRNFSEQLDQCEGDPAKIAECFVRNNEGFVIYAEYCTNYPSAVEVLTKVMKDPFLSEKFKEQQISLGHSLPLGAYLLKPVQRVLKYHLLLHNILKNFDKSDPGHVIVSQALDHMTGRAQHINEMKRKHEHAVRVQEIQSTLEDYEGEDLTRLGELVLESTFRTYNAKTSRHVFLFEKGVLIAKRKENAMLSCKIFIECSNLMLVESLPKEPLSFQVIPFDNPRGQHILQARNLDQKRKWCQEIKRLILESFKGKIPEKVKGLVMQLGKSKTDDSADTKKFHHLAPDYLEKRQRLRRKSGGTLLTDILKPQRVRKAQKRAESVSPRVSPTMERKLKLTTTHSSASIDSKTLTEGDECSIGGTDDLGSSSNVAESDSASVVSLSSQADLPNKPKSNVGRSTSFRTAMRARPLRSQDFEDQAPPSPIHKTPESTPTRRTKSFKIATRLKPLLMRELSRENSSLPSSPRSPCTKLEFSESSNSSNDISEQDQVFTEGQPHLGKCSSLPVLNKTESAITRNRRSECTPRLSNGSYNIGDLKQTPKKLIDARLYFSRSRDDNLPVSNMNDSEDTHNLRLEGKSVSAFNDSFLKKSTENIQKSPNLVTKAITLTKPLSVRNVLNNTYDRMGEDSKVITSDDPWVYNPSMTSMENLISEKENVHNPVSPSRNRHQRTRSYGGEIDNDADDNFDWIVYKNRNSLPLLDARDIDEQNLQASMQRTHLSGNFCAGTSENKAVSPRTFASETGIDLHVTKSGFDDTGPLPMVSKAPDKMVVHCRKQVKVSRSNSTPCARPDRYTMFRRQNRTQSVDVDCLDDPDKLLAEMEDYMRKSESTTTLSSQQRFPTRLAVSPEEVHEDIEPNRDSYVSTVSSSSYESHESTDTQGSDGIVGTLKHKLQDFTKKMYRRSGSYDNKTGSGEELDDSDVEHAKVKPQESKTSLWSLNTWFSPKKESRPDLSTVLHAGDLGGPGIGSRMADPDPIYAEIGIPQSRQATLPRQLSVCYGTNPVSVSVKAETPKSYDNAQDTCVQNLNLQQSDSAFSIDLGDSTSSASDDSPRVLYSEVKDPPLATTLKKADSFYEKRLSMAFNDNDFFRDSAVYCDADLDNPLQSPTISTPTEAKPPRLPIKEYVQRLEEQSRSRPPLTTKVRQREPADMIKRRLESLQNSCTRRSLSCSRPCSEDRELRRLSSIDSRRSSEERELRRSSYSSSRSVSVDRETTPLRFSLVNMDGCLRDSIVRTKDDQYRSFGRENSEPGFRGRSRSRSKSPGGTLKPASSTGRLDQLSSDVENLVIMKGWVRQLIDRFQPSGQ